MLVIILVQAVRWAHPRAAEMIIGHGRVFCGYTHISRLSLQKSSHSVSVFVSFLRPCQECRGSRTPSSDPPDLHRQKSRSRADISPLSSSVPHSHAHTPSCRHNPAVCVFSHWQQVCEYREDLCAGLPLLFLLLCFWTPLLSKDWLPSLILLHYNSHKHSNKISLRMHLLSHQYLFYFS